MRSTTWLITMVYALMIALTLPFGVHGGPFLGVVVPYLLAAVLVIWILHFTFKGRLQTGRAEMVLLLVGSGLAVPAFILLILGMP